MKTLQTMLTRCRDTVCQLHRDDRGAEGLEKLLIIAAIVLPLLGVLIVFRKEMKEWVETNWSQVRTGGKEETIDTGP